MCISLTQPLAIPKLAIEVLLQLAGYVALLSVASMHMHLITCAYKAIHLIQSSRHVLQ